jgi:hypothetical protein
MFTRLTQFPHLVNGDARHDFFRRAQADAESWQKNIRRNQDKILGYGEAKNRRKPLNALLFAE